MIYLFSELREILKLKEISSDWDMMLCARQSWIWMILHNQASAFNFWSAEPWSWFWSWWCIDVESWSHCPKMRTYKIMDRRSWGTVRTSCRRISVSGHSALYLETCNCRCWRAWSCYMARGSNSSCCNSKQICTSSGSHPSSSWGTIAVIPSLLLLCFWECSGIAKILTLQQSDSADLSLVGQKTCAHRKNSMKESLTNKSVWDRRSCTMSRLHGVPPWWMHSEGCLLLQQYDLKCRENAL